MTRKRLFSLQLILLLALMIIPHARVDACTTTPTPSPTASYTPTSTATNVPPGVTPAPSLTPTASHTPAPTLSAAGMASSRVPVVFRGKVLAVEKQGEWEESVLVEVHEYYKGEGNWLVRVTGLNTYRLCHWFNSEPGTEAVFYVNMNRVRPHEFYPYFILGHAPEGVPGRVPNGARISFGWLETAALGLATLGGALVVVWMVRPRQ